ncbi:hypothetical protein [Paenibacillus sp. NFR01]|uniref:hypothetical protein n=1 Tax=Paenibacillus sp. NFR01 TaxID=1566279 RepID=UPI0008CAECCB|nr:hypothetical protein [Paenibacillus sp. NFR01]SEU25959.1 hypothetical protein SAMN03159358_4442 [Paenibacillus sp. NFR01]
MVKAGRQLENQGFEETVDGLLARAGNGVAVKYVLRFPEDRMVGGKYQMSTHTIYLYIEEIIRQCRLLFGSIDRLKEYMAVITAHELGHSVDSELPGLADRLDKSLTIRERAEIQLRIEENAWKYAVTLLPEIDSDFMRRIIDESLSSYRLRLENEIA